MLKINDNLKFLCIYIQWIKYPQSFIGSMLHSEKPIRLIEYDGFRIFADKCSSCPSMVKPWITQFHELEKNKWYVPIEPAWVADWFNQYGIRDAFKLFDEAVELITDKHSDKWPTFDDDKICKIHVEAVRIYGLLHQRWIAQPKGLELMKKKYDQGVFGYCPRVNCRRCKLLPMGTTLEMRKHSVKLFCPCCCDLYKAQTKYIIDGAHFGPMFPSLFLFEYTKYDISDKFVPFEYKVFEFKVHRDQPRALPHDTNIHDNDILNSEDNE